MNRIGLRIPKVGPSSVRYIIVGGLTFGLYSLLLIAARAISSNEFVLAVLGALAFLAATSLNYLGHYHYTYESKRPHRHTLWRFVLVMLLGAGLLSVLTAVFVEELSATQLVLLQIGYASN